MHVQPVHAALLHSAQLPRWNGIYYSSRRHLVTARAPRAASSRKIARRSGRELHPNGWRQHLEHLGVPTDSFHGLQNAGELDRNAEPALATLLALTSRQRVRTLLVGHPQLLCVPIGVWLDFLTAYGMSRQDFFSLLGSCPELFTRGSLFNAGNVIAYLQSLGLSPRDVVASVIPRNAGVLLRDVGSGLTPAVEFLRQGLGLDAEGVRDFLCRCPGVLSLDAAADLTPRLDLLVGAGFERGTACRLLVSDGSLLTGDLAAALQLRLSFLSSECGLSAAQALAVLRRCPEALSLSLPNLSRKWRFLTQRMGCGREQVLEYPQYLSRNLLLHIGPRFAYTTERLGLPWSGDGAGSRATLGSGGQSGALHACTSARRSSSSSSRSSSSNNSNGSSGNGSCSSSSSGEVTELNLPALFEGDDLHFLRRVWAAAAAASAPAAPGSSAGGSGTGVDGLDAHSVGGAGDDGGGAEEAWGLGEAGGRPWPGLGPEVGPGLGPGAAPGDAASGQVLLADFARFRSDWLEREGARWTGVRTVAGGMTGSW